MFICRRGEKGGPEFPENHGTLERRLSHKNLQPPVLAKKRFEFYLKAEKTSPTQSIPDANRCDWLRGPGLIGGGRTSNIKRRTHGYEILAVRARRCPLHNDFNKIKNKPKF
ncbi:hypothetical protein AVEN_162483-1 [Araneus ventricosus]|uniref:Uncharacterized protein n=1 Tax=Araneus ventricosus TaxID=182803 RepID=A0A4Y2SBN2_ARAVE|nr:hypothetical protein AVEN_162483-1 [Araneus ventricosus]